MAKRRVKKKVTATKTAAATAEQPKKKRKVRRRKKTGGAAAKASATTKKKAAKKKATTRRLPSAKSTDPQELARYYNKRNIGELLRHIDSSSGKRFPAYSGAYDSRTETHAQKNKLVALIAPKESPDDMRWKLTDLGRAVAKELKKLDDA